MALSRTMRPLQTMCAACSRLPIPSRSFSAAPLSRDTTDSSLPKVAQPTFWTSLIPRTLRARTTTNPHQPTAPPKPWNPATIFIFLGILVGSNAIQIIALRNEMLNFSRKTEAKLSLLREVVQRVKNGEEVDVRGLLGTGDEVAEGEWDEVMRELEGADMVAEGKRKREERRRERARKREEGEAERRREGEAGKGEREAEKGGERPKFIM